MMAIISPPYAKAHLDCLCVTCTEILFGICMLPRWFASFILLIAFINEINLKESFSSCLINRRKEAGPPRTCKPVALELFFSILCLTC